MWFSGAAVQATNEAQPAAAVRQPPPVVHPEAMQLARDIEANTGIPYPEALTHVLNGGLTPQLGTRAVQPHATPGVKAEQASSARVKPERSAVGSNGLPRSQPGSASAAGRSCETESSAYDEEGFEGEAVGVEDEAALQVMQCSSAGGRALRSWRKLGLQTPQLCVLLCGAGLFQPRALLEGSLGVWSRAASL